jgi:hypothetical protein
MHRLVLVLALAAALGAAFVIAVAPSTGQVTLPTPKGHLGGRMPLDETPLGPVLPLPTPPPPRPTATTAPSSSGTPTATPIASPAPA